MIIESGLAIDDDIVYVSITPEYGSRECDVYYYSIEDGVWFNWLKLGCNIIGITFEENESEGRIHLMDEEGFFSHASESEKLSNWSKIKDAGVYSADAKNYGYLNRLRVLQDNLYAVGNSGQIYRSMDNKTKWAHFDKGILQQPIDKDSRTKDIIDLKDISGINNDLYCCGDYSSLYHFSSNRWEKINISSCHGDLYEIVYESEDNIYICGSNGTLLQGNKASGFLNICPENISMDFISIADHKGSLYLASDNQIFRCDYSGKNFEQVDVLHRNDISFKNLISTGEILWSIGFKEVIYLDGNEWIAIPNPKDSE